MRAQSEVEPVLEDPREGEETETSEKGGEAGETKRAQATHLAMGPREGEETEKVQEDPSSLVIRTDLTELVVRQATFAVLTAARSFASSPFRLRQAM
jgi:hypothetical protein